MWIYVGLKMASKVVKENWEQGIHNWYKGSNIYEGLLDFWWDSKWQVKVLRMRYDMLLHSLKLGRLVTWDEYCCQGKQVREKVNETWVDVYILSQIGKLTYKIELRIQIDKEDFIHDTNQHEFKMDG